ncbi:MAG: hypothetical protein H6858_01655 [Rhodospirillales bacterium]|nr:hypothetical protein [Alphaproteobacteria bacterium]MCB9976288.1 hypothetical protein [Rhodospirillales bacterium]
MGWLSNAWDKVSGAGAALFKAETWEAVGSGISSAASAVGSGISTGLSWTNDHVIQPTGHAIAVTARAIGGDAEAQHEFGQAMDATGHAIAGAVKGTGNYLAFVATHPVLATRQAGQGLLNSVTGITSMAVDAVIYAGEGIGKGVYNLGAAAVNLGADPGEHIVDYVGMSSFSKLQSLAEEYTGNLIGLSRDELNQMVERGELTEQQASFAAGTKYGFQAVGEVASFVAVSALTAGAGGAAMAAARGGALGVRALEVGEAIARTGRIGRIVARPLLAIGSDIGATRTALYMERAAALAESTPESSWLARVFARGPLRPLRVFDPKQTEQVFARIGQRGFFESGPIRQAGLRAAEGGFKWTNPFQVNGRSPLLWGIEGGGMTMSYVSNSGRENLEATIGTQQRQATREAGEREAEDMLRQYGYGPEEGSGSDTEHHDDSVSPESGGSQDRHDEETPGQPLRQGFQDHADRDTGITHVFTIEGFEGLKQPTELDPLGRDEGTGDGRTYTPAGPGRQQ